MILILFQQFQFNAIFVCLEKLVVLKLFLKVKQFITRIFLDLLIFFVINIFATCRVLGSFFVKISEDNG